MNILCAYIQVLRGKLKRALGKKIKYKCPQSSDKLTEAYDMSGTVHFTYILPCHSDGNPIQWVPSFSTTDEEAELNLLKRVQV